MLTHCAPPGEWVRRVGAVVAGATYVVVERGRRVFGARRTVARGSSPLPRWPLRILLFPATCDTTARARHPPSASEPISPPARRQDARHYA